MREKRRSSELSIRKINSKLEMRHVEIEQMCSIDLMEVVDMNRSRVNLEYIC